MSDIEQQDPEAAMTADLDPEESAVDETGIDRKFLERMAMLTERAGGSSALARKAGISRAVIDKYRAGRSDPSRRRLVRLARAGNVGVGWLATGDGSMEPEIELLDARVIPARPRGQLKPSGDHVHVWPYTLSGEELASFSDQALEKSVSGVIGGAFWRTISHLGIPPVHVLVAGALGDEMLPTIGRGNLLLLDSRISSAPEHVSNGDLCVLKRNEERMLRRIFWTPEGGLILECDNPAFVRETIPAEQLADVMFLGRVFWVGSVPERRPLLPIVPGMVSARVGGPALAG